jgi:hypothetical protein
MSMLAEEQVTFVDRRAVPSIRKVLRNRILDDIKSHIDRDTKKNIQQVLFTYEADR